MTFYSNLPFHFQMNGKGLSEAEKKYLAIQAMSCASERTFSTGGATVSSKKTKLDPTNVHYLVYSKENLPKIKLVRPRLEDNEEGRGTWRNNSKSKKNQKKMNNKSNYTCEKTLNSNFLHFYLNQVYQINF